MKTSSGKLGVVETTKALRSCRVSANISALGTLVWKATFRSSSLFRAIVTSRGSLSFDGNSVSSTTQHSHSRARSAAARTVTSASRSWGTYNLTQ
eukprot:6488204-Amphidinium_carterae.3